MPAHFLAEDLIGGGQHDQATEDDVAQLLRPVEERVEYAGGRAGPTATEELFTVPHRPRHRLGGGELSSVFLFPFVHPMPSFCSRDRVLLGIIALAGSGNR
jgi:hypothetical protein